MKNILITIIIILTILNLTFLIETTKNQDLKNYYYFGDELSDDYIEKEKTHMKEVKDLINISLIINAALLFSLLAIKEKTNYKKIGKYLISFSSISYIAAIFFQQFFHNFHLILFNSNNWLLPADSKLIQNYPLEYFRNIFLTINTIYLILGIFFQSKTTIFKNIIKFKNLVHYYPKNH
jgi:integral membrane protein (TIGR01906 family)